MPAEKALTLSQSTVPPILERAVIRESVHCRSCGYNLRGLPVSGRCPECGSEVWENILHTVDPAASRLPRLLNPRRVGTSLVWLMGCLLAGGLLMTVFALLKWLEATNGVSRPPFFHWIPVLELPWLAGVAGFAGLIGIWGLARPQGPDPTGVVRRDLRLMGLGLVLWSIVLLVRGLMIRQEIIKTLEDPAWPALSLVSDIGALVGLVGMRGVLLAIGLRSREYRNAAGARQGLRAMVAAVCAHAGGRLTQLINWSVIGGSTALAGMSQVLVAISWLMLVIGLAYLLVNAWWIRTSLRRPPPALEEIIQIPDGGGEDQVKSVPSRSAPED